MAPILESIGSGSTNSHWERRISESSNLDQLAEEFPSLLPMAMKISAKTVGLDIVSVKPMSGPGGMSKEERESRTTS